LTILEGFMVMNIHTVRMYSLCQHAVYNLSIHARLAAWVAGKFPIRLFTPQRLPHWHVLLPVLPHALRAAVAGSAAA
jgi:hypothetical protein